MDPEKSAAAAAPRFMSTKCGFPFFLSDAPSDIQNHFHVLGFRKAKNTEDPINGDSLVFPNMTDWLSLWDMISKWAVFTCKCGNALSAHTIVGIIDDTDDYYMKCPLCRKKTPLPDYLAGIVNLFRNIRKEHDRLEGAKSGVMRDYFTDDEEDTDDDDAEEEEDEEEDDEEDIDENDVVEGRNNNEAGNDNNINVIEVNVNGLESGNIHEIIDRVSAINSNRSRNRNVIRRRR